MSARARRELAAADPTMAALIERVGKIDLQTRLRRRREGRPADAYGTLLRAIVGQQLSTKAAQTIYLRVHDLFERARRRPSSCWRQARRTCAAPASPAARLSTSATSPPIC